MKKFQITDIKFGMVIAMLLSILTSSAYDFKVDGIYYNVLSLDDLTCEVTYNAENEKLQNLYFDKNSGVAGGTSLSITYPSYKGTVIVPEKVSYKGRTLTVTGVGRYAFLNCSELTSLSLPSSILNISEVMISSYYDCYAGAFDYCDIQTFTAGNAYTLQMFNRSNASYKTKGNLKNLILSNDFEGIIDVNYSLYANLELLKSLTPNVPTYSDGTHFSNDQYLNMEVLVPEDAFSSYKSAMIWKDFWELKAMKSVKSITLNKTSLSLEPKQEFQLSATVAPEDAFDGSVTW